MFIIKKEYTQEELLEKSPYLYDSEKNTYWKELKKTGYFQTTTKNKIEKIYKDNHFGVAWIGRGKNKKLKVGKKKPNPKPRIDNRGGNYTEYAEIGAKLLAHHINKLILRSHSNEPSNTRINWLSTANLTSNYQSTFVISDSIASEIKSLIKTINKDDSDNEMILYDKLITEITYEYKWIKNEFYREVFTSISNYLYKEYGLKFDKTLHGLFFKEVNKDSSLNASLKHDYYLNHKNAIDVYNGFKVKLDKEDSNDIVNNQNWFLSNKNLTKKDLIVKRNSQEVRKYFKEEQRFLKYNYNINKIWEQQTVSADYIPTPFRYGLEKREVDTDTILSMLEKRWQDRLITRIDTTKFEGVFKLYYFHRLDAELSNKHFNSAIFLKEFEYMFNEDTKLLNELFESSLNNDLFDGNEGLYFKVLLELVNKYIS